MKLAALLSVLMLLSSCKRIADNRDFNPEPSGKSNEIVSEKNKDVYNEDLTQGKLALKAKIIRIVDGDTAELLYNEELPLMLRLQHIDAPEKRGNQPFGKKAKIILSDLCFGPEVTILTDGDFDMGGRLIGEIINEEGLNVNKEMVRLGYAWHFKKYSIDKSYDALEQDARHLKRGLWQESDAITPWDFR